MSADRFGIPDNVLGVHGEDFYGAIGRIAGLSALVEHQALTIFQTMTNSPQEAHTKSPASQVADESPRVLKRLKNSDGQQTLFGYFNDVETAMRERNGYVHRLWSAQPNGQLFGWRPTRDKNSPAGHSDGIHAGLSELRAFIRTLIELIQGRDRVHVAACTQQQLLLAGAVRHEQDR